MGDRFQFDSLHDGRRFKIASTVDEHTRESLLDIVDWSITGEHLVDAISALIAKRGAPTVIRCNNGPELVFDALQSLCADRTGIRYIPPGEPWNNGYVESFNNRVRDECLNPNQWLSLLHPRVGIGD